MDLIIRSPAVDFIARGASGPPGPAAAVGALFAWAGTLLASEPAQVQVAPTDGVLNPAHWPGSCDVAATENSVFVLSVDGVGLGTVTYLAGIKTPVFSLTALTAYAKGALFKAQPPASPDLTLSGASFALLN